LEWGIFSKWGWRKAWTASDSRRGERKVVAEKGTPKRAKDPYGTLEGSRCAKPVSKKGRLQKEKKRANRLQGVVCPNDGKETMDARRGEKKF